MAHKYMNVVSVKKNGFNNLKTNKIMKQTAVEWLYNKINNDFENNDFLISYANEIEQAKEMEKQQIDDAWDKGYKQGKYDPYFDNEDDDNI
jgi:hypothetical protein